MPSCAIATCKNTNRNTKDTNIKYFGFPKNEDLAKQWINACCRKDKINLKNARICSLHFEENCFEVSMRQRLLQYLPKNSRNLKSDAVPLLQLPVTCQKKDDLHRSKRIDRRNQRDTVRHLLQESELNESYVHNSSENFIGNIKPHFISEPLMIETALSKCAINVESSEVTELKEKMKILEEQNKNLLLQVMNANSIKMKYEQALAKVFTPGQIKKLMNSEKKKKIHWSHEDISSAISLRSVSPKAYRYLRANNYPLPALSTLRSYVSNFDVNEYDGLPKYSCTKCVRDVKIALITKKRIIKSHKALIQHLKRKKEQIREQSTLINAENDEQKLPVVLHSYIDDSENESEPLSFEGAIKIVNVDSPTTLETVSSIVNVDEQGSKQNGADYSIKNVAEVTNEIVADDGFIRGDKFGKNRKQDNTEILCEHGNLTFNFRKEYQAHKKKHMKTKCPICKNFIRSDNFKRHVLLHNAPPASCEICGATYKNVNSLRIHIYRCHKLKAHKRQHTNKKPYICEFCNEGFKQKNSMRTHMKSKHGYVEPNESVCEQCGKGFASAFALKIHERLHLITAKCELCSDSFTAQRYLKNHLEQVHGIETNNVEAEEDTL